MHRARGGKVEKSWGTMQMNAPCCMQSTSHYSFVNKKNSVAKSIFLQNFGYSKFKLVTLLIVDKLVKEMQKILSSSYLSSCRKEFGVVCLSIVSI